MKVTVPVRRGTGKGHVQHEEFDAPAPDPVIIPHAQYEALMAAAKALIEKQRQALKIPGCQCDACKAIVGLRAAGIKMEE